MPTRRKFNDKEKWCNKCKAFFPLESFSNDPKTASGRRTYCKRCESKDVTEFRNRDNGYRKRQADQVRIKRREKISGLTETALTVRWLSQAKCCGICRKHIELATACLDHSHSSGRMRGFLCAACNLLLGHCKDDVTILRRAIEYLEKSEVPVLSEDDVRSTACQQIA
jgi:hypothetical protein